MRLRIHQENSTADLFPKRHAQYVVATLGLLIDVVGRRSLLGKILDQTRNEVLSVMEPTSTTTRRAA